MESFPPIAASSKAFWTVYAPNNALNGLPHEISFLPSFSKYSWKDKTTLCQSPPIATILVIDSITL
jgi:hypothetical protein